MAGEVKWAMLVQPLQSRSGGSARAVIYDNYNQIFAKDENQMSNRRTSRLAARGAAAAAQAQL